MRRADDVAMQRICPGALDDSDGMLMAGNGPDLAPELTESLSLKTLIRDCPGVVESAVLEAGARLWLLLASFGATPERPMLLLGDSGGWA